MRRMELTGWIIASVATCVAVGAMVSAARWRRAYNTQWTAHVKTINRLIDLEQHRAKQ